MTSLQKAIQRIETYETPSYFTSPTALMVSFSTSSTASASLSLANLGLTSKDLEQLMPRLKKLIGLKKIDLSNNNFTSLPDSIRNLTSLEELNVSNKNLEKLPNSIEKLTKLQVLNLANNNLKRVTNRIASLNELKALNLANNKLKRLTWAILDNMRFENLILDNNSSILSIARGLKELLYYDAISAIGSIANRTQTHRKGGVQALEIERRISSSNETLDLSGLNLTNETLAQLMPRLEELPNLKKLNLSSNNLTILPEDIGILKNLETLNLENNGFTELPESIADLNNLRTLNLSVNDFTVLPKKLHELTHLDVSNNPRISLSNLKENLPNLERLTIDKFLSLENLVSIKDSIRSNPKPETPSKLEELPKVYGLTRELTDLHGQFLDHMKEDFITIAKMIVADKSLNINTANFISYYSEMAFNRNNEIIKGAIQGDIPLSELVTDIEEYNTSRAKVVIDDSQDLNALTSGRTHKKENKLNSGRRKNKKTVPKGKKIASGTF